MPIIAAAHRPVSVTWGRYWAAGLLYSAVVPLASSLMLRVKCWLRHSHSHP